MSYRPAPHVGFVFAGIKGWPALLRPAPHLSPNARKRLRWMDHYRQCGNAALTCRYFGISRKTFYVWKGRYNPKDLSTLETHSSAPLRRRQRTTTAEQEIRIIALRRRYIRYGKMKLARYYEDTYGAPMSSWHIQKVIEKKGLYYHPAKPARIARKRRNAVKKKRITELKKLRLSGFLLCLDVVVIYWNGMKRYIFTAIDHTSKIAFARMYGAKSSRSAADFLLRLHALMEGTIENVAHDNGREFQKHFARECRALGIDQYFSRPKTPKDNAVCERFNQTLQHEFLALGNFTPDITLMNRQLTEWLAGDNFPRAPQAPGGIHPLNFSDK